jgi:hypothetical protein
LNRALCAAWAVIEPRLAEVVDSDRHIVHRLAQFALAIAMITTVQLVKWADRWSPNT